MSEVGFACSAIGDGGPQAGEPRNGPDDAPGVTRGGPSKRALGRGPASPAQGSIYFYARQGLHDLSVVYAVSVSGWTFLTNHARVLRCVAKDPGIRLRDIALAVDITERAAQRIVAELVEANYLTRTRNGRRNIYGLHPGLPLRHPLESGFTIGELLDFLGARDARSVERTSST